MLPEEFYGDHLKTLKNIQKIMFQIFEKMLEKYPGVYFSTRIKSVPSMQKKLSRRGVPVNGDSAVHAVNDAVGFRIICRWSDNIYEIAEFLKQIDELEVKRIKDYVAYPKPNGYRSYHLIVCLKKIPDINFVIQIRTVAMDLWSNIDHDTQYKKKRKIPKYAKLLRRCADDIASLDQTILKIKKFRKFQK